MKNIQITLAEINSEIAAKEAAVQPLFARLEELKRKKADLESLQFIAVNRITKGAVEMSSGEDLPYFGTIYEFAKWLAARRPVKTWAEWNGRIYHTSDILNGRLPDMPARIEDLTE